MSYKILEIHAVFKEGQLDTLAVLWYSNSELNWVRASYCNRQPIGGYKFLLPSDSMGDQLIQKVAGQGMNLPDDLKTKFFPGIRKWER